MKQKRWMVAAGRGEAEGVCREHWKYATKRGHADVVSFAKEMSGHARSEHAVRNRHMRKIPGRSQVVRVADAHNSHVRILSLVDCQTHGLAGGNQSQSR